MFPMYPWDLTLSFVGVSFVLSEHGGTYRCDNKKTAEGCRACHSPALVMIRGWPAHREVGAPMFDDHAQSKSRDMQDPYYCVGVQFSQRQKYTHRLVYKVVPLTTDLS